MKPGMGKNIRRRYTPIEEIYGNKSYYNVKMIMYNWSGEIFLRKK